jgi:hypothetical protein
MGDYVLVTTAESDVKPGAPAGAVNGGFFPKKADWPAQYPSIVIGVDDIESAMRRVGKEGGKVLGEPMQIPGVGKYVSFFDTEGNRLACYSLIAREERSRDAKCNAFQTRSFIASLAFDRRHITRDRFFQHGFAALRDDAVEVMTVDRLERERLKCCADVFDCARRQWNEIRIASHER